MSENSGSGVNALEGGCDFLEDATSLSIRAFSIPKDTRRLCRVSGDKLSKALRAGGDGNDGGGGAVGRLLVVIEARRNSSDGL